MLDAAKILRTLRLSGKRLRVADKDVVRKENSEVRISSEQQPLRSNATGLLHVVERLPCVET